MKNQISRSLIAIGIFIASLAIMPIGCSTQNLTPDQITATTQGIATIETTTGQIVIPAVVHYQNGQSVKVQKPKKPKPTPTPTTP